MNKASGEYRALLARKHKAWYATNVKDKSKIRYFPFETDWAEAAETMTAAEQKFYKVHIEKSLWIKGLIDDILAKM